MCFAIIVQSSSRNVRLEIWVEIYIYFMYSIIFHLKLSVTVNKTENTGGTYNLTPPAANKGCISSSQTIMNRAKWPRDNTTLGTGKINNVFRDNVWFGLTRHFFKAPRLFFVGGIVADTVADERVAHQVTGSGNADGDWTLLPLFNAQVTWWVGKSWSDRQKQQ